MIPKPLGRAGAREGPASRLHLTATAGAAEEGARAQGHLAPPPYTHFLDGLLGVRPRPLSYSLSATFSRGRRGKGEQSQRRKAACRKSAQSESTSPAIGSPDTLAAATDW